MNKETKEIQEWWNSNPFTFGVAGEYAKQDLVGRVGIERLDLHFFNEIERKFRKHSGIGAQADDQPLLIKLLPYSLHDKKILDVATGSGLFAVSFASRGAAVTAIDLTEYSVTEAKINLKIRNLTGEVLQMDAQDMSLKSESFDFVNAWGCLMHMPETQRAIGEIYRVLKSDGRVLAYMYNRSSWPFWFNIFFLRGILLGGLIRYKGNLVRLTSRYSDGASIGGNMLTKFYTSTEIKKMFSKAGFVEVEAYPWNIGYEPDHWPLRKFPIFKYLPHSIKKRMAHKWGYGLIVQAKK